MKKTIMIIGIIIMIIMARVTTVNAVTATAELKASSTTVKPGDTFTVILSLTTDKGVESIGGDQRGVRDNDFFAIEYEESKLEVTNQEVIGTGIMDSGIDIDDETGESYGRATNNVELWGTSISSGDLYKWTFKVKSDAEPGDVEISTSKLILTDFSDEETEVQTKPVTITVASNSSNTGNEGGNNNGGASEIDNNVDGGNDGKTDGGNQQDADGIQNDKTNGNDDGKQASGSGTPGKLDGGITKGGSSVSGKNPDTTTAASAGKIIPSAGSVAIKGLLIAGIAIIGVRAYKKFNQLRDVK